MLRRRTSQKPSPAPRPTEAALLPLAALVVAFAGLFTTGVLGASQLMDLPVPCGGSRGCLIVANHPSSRLFGMPIALLGVAAYLAVVVLLVQGGMRPLARLTLVVVTGSGTAVSAMLLVYSRTVIRATCSWCIASAVAMVLLLVLAVCLLKMRRPIRKPRLGLTLGLGLLAAGGVGVQTGLMQTATLMPPVPAERLDGLSAAELVDPAKSLGPEDAAATIVMFADLQCPACRSVHASLIRFQRAQPARVRLAFRHLPLIGIRGHELSGTAGVLSEIAAEQGRFWPFVDQVYRQRGALNVAKLLELLRRQGIKSDGVKAPFSDPGNAALERVRRDMDLAARLGIHATPTFLVLARGRPPISANQRTLRRILNSLARDGARPARRDAHDSTRLTGNPIRHEDRAGPVAVHLPAED